MKVLIAYNSKIPVTEYGGTERVIWWLGKELIRLGHEVLYLVPKGSVCPFAKVLVLNEKKTIAPQIPIDIDIAHFHFDINETLDCPVLFTSHQNAKKLNRLFHPNTVFVSKNHAARHGGKFHVYNGLDFEDYGTPDLDHRRRYLHFLANAAWKVKNVEGAIEIAKKADERLHVIGGSRFNFRKGMRFTWATHVRFHGMLADEGKNVILNSSKGLVFPVLWDEPFGLSIIESLYFGCPVFGTPRGSLPELLGLTILPEQTVFKSDYGALSESADALADIIRNEPYFDAHLCSQYAQEKFNSKVMAKQYEKLYLNILNGNNLHEGQFGPNNEGTAPQSSEATFLA